jgi:hypothetical protein
MEVSWFSLVELSEFKVSKSLDFPASGSSLEGLPSLISWTLPERFYKHPRFADSFNNKMYLKFNW